MRILLAAPEYPPATGGGSSYVHWLAKVLHRDSTEVAVITSGSIDEKISDQGILVFRFRSYANSLNSYSISAAMIDDTLKVIKEFHPSVVHAHHTTAILVCTAISNHFPLPLVFTQHRTPEHPASHTRHDGKASLADIAYDGVSWASWIAPSRFFATRLLSAGIPAKDIDTIYPSIDRHTFTTNSIDELNIRKCLPLLPEKFIILPIVDRPRKDIEFVLRSVDGKSLPILITGLDEGSDRYRSLVKEYQKTTIIKHGEIPSALMPSLYQKASFTILSSTHEGLGLSGLEALACGARLLLRDSPGLREIAKFQSSVSLFREEKELKILLNREYSAQDGATIELHETFSVETQRLEHMKVYSKVMTNEFSAGGFCFSFSGGNLYVRLVTNKNGKINVPKGHLKDGESWEDAARREIKEETGLAPTGAAFYTGETSYSFELNGRPVIKTVRYYTFILDSLEEGSELELEESESVVSSSWIIYADALSKLEHESDREIIRKAKAIFDDQRALSVY